MSIQHRFLSIISPSGILLFLFCILFLPTDLSPGRLPAADSDDLAEQRLPPTDFADYIWPTDAGQIITSTFAEYRRAHFHGGIDVSTGNETGFRVFAARDGWVSRIRVSPTGYGKMLYVRHADGYYTTYAHLRNFNSVLDARVRKEQSQTGVYPLDIQCRPEEFPVKKGEIIAYTGETGVGSPHLHFEIRDEQMEFVNPLLCNTFPRSERILPVVRKLAVQPLGQQSLVDGLWDTKVVDVRERSPGQYEVPGELHFTGEVGFEIDVRDQSGGSRFRHGVYSHELYVDDRSYYSVILNRAPSADAHQSGLYYDWDLSDAGRGKFQRLFVASFNNLPFYSPRGERSGIISPADFTTGLHTFRIVSTDLSGNSTTVTGKFTLNHPPRFRMTGSREEIFIHLLNDTDRPVVRLATRRWESAKWNGRTITPEPGQDRLRVPVEGFDVLKVVMESAYGSVSSPAFFFVTPPGGREEGMDISHEHGSGFIRIHVRSDGMIAPNPVVKLYEGDSVRTIGTTALDINHYVGAFIPRVSFGGVRRVSVTAAVNGTEVTDFHEFAIYPILRGNAGSHIIDGGNLLLSYDSTSVLGTLFLEVEEIVLEDQTPGTLAYRLMPERTVLDEGVVVSMRAPRGERETGLFARNRRGWELLAGGRENTSGVLSGRLTQTLGEVGVISDSVPPSISRLEIRARRPGMPDISFRFSDDFSGVEYHELKMYIDKTVAVPELDGEHHRAIYHASEPLQKGAHLLTIVLKDKLGNTATTERRFTVK